MKKKHENFQFFQIISLEKINKEFLVCHFFLSFLMSLLFFTHCKALKLLVFSTKGNGNGRFPFKFWLPHFIVQGVPISLEWVKSNVLMLRSLRANRATFRKNHILLQKIAFSASFVNCKIENGIYKQLFRIY